MDGPVDAALLRQVPEDVRRQSIVLFEDGDWLIGVPLTPWAAGWWGAFTQWCPARDDAAFHFDHRQGPR